MARSPPICPVYTNSLAVRHWGWWRYMSASIPPLVPGIDEQRGPFVLKPCGHSIDVDGEHGALTSPGRPTPRRVHRTNAVVALSADGQVALSLWALPLRTAYGV
jgi:hypothetical protein